MALPPYFTTAFPNARSHAVTSPEERVYNCFAWAAGETDRNWGPGEYWPEGVPPTPTIHSFARAYAPYGYEWVGNDKGTLEAGKEKIALYFNLSMNRDGSPTGAITHAARQLPTGRWTSKLGPSHDIEHDLADLEGPEYGRATYFLVRERPEG